MQTTVYEDDGMKVQQLYFVCKWLDKLMGITQAEQQVQNRTKNASDQVDQIKQVASDKLDEATAVVNRVGKLQGQVIKKTTTYYLGKAMGGVQ